MKRGTPLKRYTPMRRTWMRRKAPRRTRRAGHDPAYLASVRTLPCMLAGPTCFGRVHAHHAVYRSQGGKDDTAVPLCLKHHEELHDHCGAFRGLSKMDRFALAVQWIARTQAAVAAQRRAA